MGEPVRGTGAVAQHQKGDIEVGLRFFPSMILTSCAEEPQPMSVSVPVPPRVKPGLRLRGLESNVETTFGRLSPPRSPAKPPGLENDNLRIRFATESWQAKLKPRPDRLPGGVSEAFLPRP